MHIKHQVDKAAIVYNKSVKKYKKFCKKIENILDKICKMRYNVGV